MPNAHPPAPGVSGMGQTLPPRRVTPGVGGAIVFWWLVVMGVSVFATCVLLPEWRKYEQLHAAEQIAAHHTSVVQREVERELRVLDAIRTDPGVVARLAKRDLGFRSDEEAPVGLHVAVAARSATQPFVPTPAKPPTLVASAVTHLPNLDYDAIFCNPETRLTIMAMSLGIITVAFILFEHRPAREV